MGALSVILTLVEVLPRIAASGAEAYARIIDAFRDEVTDEELRAKLEAMKSDDIRRALISEAEASS